MHRTCLGLAEVQGRVVDIGMEAFASHMWLPRHCERGSTDQLSSRLFNPLHASFETHFDSCLLLHWNGAEVQS